MGLNATHLRRRRIASAESATPSQRAFQRAKVGRRTNRGRIHDHGHAITRAPIDRHSDLEFVPDRHLGVLAHRRVCLATHPLTRGTTPEDSPGTTPVRARSEHTFGVGGGTCTLKRNSAGVVRRRRRCGDGVAERLELVDKTPGVLRGTEPSEPVGAEVVIAGSAPRPIRRPPLRRAPPRRR